MRSKKDIENEMTERCARGSAWQITQVASELSLEVLLDIRDLLQNTAVDIVVERPLLPPVFSEPEKDPLFERARKRLLKMSRAANIDTASLQMAHKITCARASALIDQLESAGVITSKDVNGRRHVV